MKAIVEGSRDFIVISHFMPNMIYNEITKEYVPEYVDPPFGNIARGLNKVVKVSFFDMQGVSGVDKMAYKEIVLSAEDIKRLYDKMIEIEKEIIMQEVEF